MKTFAKTSVPQNLRLSCGWGRRSLCWIQGLRDSLVRAAKQGIKPEMFIGSGKSPNDPARPMFGRICPYPQVTRKGTGNTNGVSIFECAMPTTQ